MIYDVDECRGCIFIIIERDACVVLPGNSSVKLLYMSMHRSGYAVANRHIGDRHRLNVINMRIKITVAVVTL